MALFSIHNEVPETLEHKKLGFVKIGEGFRLYVGDKNNVPVPHVGLTDKEVEAATRNTKSKPFVSRWNIPEEDKTLQTPVSEGYNDYQIDWGDGTVERVIGQSSVHTYATAGVYDVKINGILKDFKLDSSYGHRNKLTEIVSWGDIEWFKLGFNGAINLTSLPIGEVPDFTNVETFSTAFKATAISEVPSGLFDSAVNSISFFQAFKDSNISIVSESLFNNCSSVKIFAETFMNCPLENVPLIFHGAVNAIDFRGCFRGTGLTSVPERLFETNIIAENFSHTFFGCDLQSIPFLLFRKNTLANNFDQCFRYNHNTTGYAPELWLYYKDAIGTSCFANSTNLDNYSEIPLDWGGVFEGTYPQVPVNGRDYWNPDTQQFQLRIDGEWKNVGGESLPWGIAARNEDNYVLTIDDNLKIVIPTSFNTRNIVIPANVFSSGNRVVILNPWTNEEMTIDHSAISQFRITEGKLPIIKGGGRVELFFDFTSEVLVTGDLVQEYEIRQGADGRLWKVGQIDEEGNVIPPTQL